MAQPITETAQEVAPVETPQATNEMQPVSEENPNNQSEDNLKMAAEGGNAPGQGDVVDNNNVYVLQNGNNELNLQKENE